MGGGVGTGKGTGKSMRKLLSKLPFSDLPLSFSPKVGIYIISSVTHLAAVTTDEKLLQQYTSQEQIIEMRQHEPLVMGV